MSNILEIRDFKVIYGKSVAIHDINIDVPEGSIVTMVGANGAGKSTTLNAMIGLVKPALGTITFRGEDISNLPIAERVRRGLTLVPEGRKLFPYLSVYKNLILGATTRSDKDGIEADMQFVFQLFPKLKNRQKQKAGTLSGGEQQMVAIARGIMTNPKLLCLDEPSVGLAPVVIEHIGESIREINRSKGTSILLIEQNVHLGFGCAEYCYALSVGEIVASGPVDEIKKSGAVHKAYFGDNPTS
jgi:branched-chain amino acid transport system ATP-binding protein